MDQQKDRRHDGPPQLEPLDAVVDVVLVNAASSAPGGGVSILSRIFAPRAQDLDRELCRPRSTLSELLQCRRRRHIPVASTAPLLSVVRATVDLGSLGLAVVVEVSDECD